MKVKIMRQVDWRGWDDRKGKVPLLEDQVNEFIADKKIIDIKYSNSISMAANEYAHNTDFNESVLIIYEDEPSTIKQKTFEYVSNDSEINDFTKKHDVIKIEHFGALDDVTTIITYKEDN